MQENGVTIGWREIYDSLQTVASDVRSLKEQFARLEDLSSDLKETDERSREALEIAKKADDKADELEKRLSWLSRTIVGALITAGIATLFSVFKH
jgi:methyl-accepting chemotaxis protein